MTADARRRAEKALLYNRTHANSPRVRAALVEALEALLAAEPAPPASDEVREAAAHLATWTFNDHDTSNGKGGCGGECVDCATQRLLDALAPALRSDGR